MTRKTFGIALCALALGQLEARALGAKSVPPNYWCTWGVQGTTLHKVRKAEKAVFAGDQIDVPTLSILREGNLIDASV